MDHGLILPEFELSYGLDRHSKVAPDAFMLAPRGQRVIVAFVTVGEDDVCYLCQLNRHHKVCKRERILASFSRDLCSGTILYGVRLGDTNSVVVEDILRWRGNPVARENLLAKARLFRDLFGRHLGACPSVRYLDITLPVWVDSAEEAQRSVPSLAYQCRAILGFSTRARGLRPLQVIQPSRGAPPTPERATLTFIAKAETTQDTYTLSAVDKAGGLAPIGRAAVPSLRCSMLMNNLFRSIKENSNLDLLEESDSDDEFEQVGEDKHVDTQKEVAMVCEFRPRFSAWEPVGPAPEPYALATEEEERSVRDGARGFSARSTHGASNCQKRRPRHVSSASKLHRAS